MININQIVPINYSEREQFALESLKLYFEYECHDELCKELKYGYNFMSKINLDLSELGFEYEIKQLCFYENSLLECEMM